jgi:hypothetical protein
VDVQVDVLVVVSSTPWEGTARWRRPTTPDTERRQGGRPPRRHYRRRRERPSSRAREHAAVRILRGSAPVVVAGQVVVPLVLLLIIPSERALRGDGCLTGAIGRCRQSRLRAPTISRDLVCQELSSNSGYCIASLCYHVMGGHSTCTPTSHSHRARAHTTGEAFGVVVRACALP